MCNEMFVTLNPWLNLGYIWLSSMSFLYIQLSGRATEQYAEGQRFDFYKRTLKVWEREDYVTDRLYKL